jgi:hypothetical protein
MPKVCGKRLSLMKDKALKRSFFMPGSFFEPLRHIKIAGREIGRHIVYQKYQGEDKKRAIEQKD